MNSSFEYLRSPRAALRRARERQRRDLRPSIRHHDGWFFLITTNRDEIRRGHLIVRSPHPEGPWSDPVYTAGAFGIDPDLSWDEQGTCRLVWSDPIRGGISMAEVDPFSGQLLVEPRTLWDGSGLAHPEGPHLFARDGWWYLVVAEGGTERGHGVSITRARTPEGPFESHPQNPVFSHRSTAHPVQSTGHADLVERPDGSWAMVYLRTRPTGSSPQWHGNGRETFLAGIDWVDDWPVVVEDRFDVPARSVHFDDHFSAAALGVDWISPGAEPGSFTTMVPGRGLELAGSRSAAGSAPAALLGFRAPGPEWQAEAALPEGDAALVLRIDDDHWFGVERIGGELTARIVLGPVDQVLAAASAGDAGDPLAIRVTAPDVPFGLPSGSDRITVGTVRGDAFMPLAEIDGRYISVEVAGGFTGRVIGIEGIDGPTTLARFTVSPPRPSSAG